MTAVAQSWLDIQCRLIPGILNAVIVKKEDSNELIPKAVWPADSGNIPKTLMKAAQHVVSRGTTVVHNSSESERQDKSCIIAAPIKDSDDSLNVAVIEIKGQSNSKSQNVIQLLQWGAVWFNLLSNINLNESENRLKIIGDVLINTLQQERFKAATTIVVTELAKELNCVQISLGVLKNKKIDIKAVSHNSQIDKRTNSMKEITMAMQEAINQDMTIAYPNVSDNLAQVSFAQEVLSNNNDGSAVITTPIYHANEIFGAMTFEYDKKITPDLTQIELLESIGALLGPILFLKYQQDRFFLIKVYDDFWKFIKSLFGTKFISSKLIILSIIGVIIYSYTHSTQFTVRATATLEPKTKQFITAPLSGYIQSSSVRAGEFVNKGQVLAKLDDNEMELERLKLKSEYEQLMIEKRAGVFNRDDRSKVSIIAAQIKQNEARLKLINEQIKHTQIISPFDGVIVTGDLTQFLGTPVKVGQSLFEVAPNNSFHLRIDVDERDISEIKQGIKGRLVLTALPNEELSFEVVRTLPISEAKDGNNYFLVEANLIDVNEVLRPGMKGVAKLDIDERKMIWVWFRRVTNWIKLQKWTWLG